MFSSCLLGWSCSIISGAAHLCSWVAGAPCSLFNLTVVWLWVLVAGAPCSLFNLTVVWLWVLRHGHQHVRHVTVALLKEDVQKTHVILFLPTIDPEFFLVLLSKSNMGFVSVHSMLMAVASFSNEGLSWPSSAMLDAKPGLLGWWVLQYATPKGFFVETCTLEIKNFSFSGILCPGMHWMDSDRVEWMAHPKPFEQGYWRCFLLPC